MVIQFSLFLFSFFNIFHFFDEGNKENETVPEPIENTIIEEPQNVFQPISYENWDKYVKKDASELISESDFFRNPRVYQMTFSPDGKRLAYIKYSYSALTIYVMDFETKKEISLTPALGNISRFFWANDNRILFVTNAPGRMDSSLFGVNRDGSHLLSLVWLPGDTDWEILTPKDTGFGKILIAMNDSSNQPQDVYEIDVTTGEKTLSEKNPGNIKKWFGDIDGKIHFAQFSDEGSESLCFREDPLDPWVDVMLFSSKDEVKPVGLSLDKKRCYYLSNIDNDCSGLYTASLCYPYFERKLFQDPRWDISKLYWSNVSGCPLGVMVEGEIPQNTFFEPKGKQLALTMKETHPSWHYSIVSMDEGETQAVLLCYSDVKPHSYYLYHFEEGMLERLMDLYPNIDPQKLCATKPISFSSLDGTVIGGYLTLPREDNRTIFPIMVHIQKPSSEQETWGYHPLIQYFANHGYGVLQINHRGLNGMEKKSHPTPTPCFVTNELDKLIAGDIAGGIQYVIKQGIGHPKYIGLYGEGLEGMSVHSFMKELTNTFVLGVELNGFFNLTPRLDQNLKEEKIWDVGYLQKNMDLLKAQLGIDENSSPFLWVQMNGNRQDIQWRVVDFSRGSRLGHYGTLYDGDDMEISSWDLSTFLRKYLGGYYREGDKLYETPLEE